jgi:hypothetical protein
MLTRRTATFIVAVLSAFSSSAAEPDPTLPFPANYRSWARVKTVLVGPSSKVFDTEGGIHHIYANDKAVEGYRTGSFPDGSVIVYDLLETKETAGFTIEGPRRRVDIMMKDNPKYSRTGAWGFERFFGDNRNGTLTAEAKAKCFACHESQKDHSSVFSLFSK